MFKTTREARLILNVNYLCYALRALFWTLIIINWTLIISLIFSLMFILVRPINCSLFLSLKHFIHTIRHRVSLKL